MMIEKRTFRDDYETEAHRRTEMETIDFVLKETNLMAHKLPKRDSLDFVLTADEKVVCFAEVRERKIRSTEFETYPLPLKKFVAMRTHFETSKTVTCLLVVYSDGIFRTWMGREESFEVYFWGDQTNDQRHDREPVVMIPVKQFERLS